MQQGKFTSKFRLEGLRLCVIVAKTTDFDSAAYQCFMSVLKSTEKWLSLQMTQIGQIKPVQVKAIVAKTTDLIAQHTSVHLY